MLQTPAEEQLILQAAEAEDPDCAAENQLTMGTQGYAEMQPAEKMPEAGLRIGSNPGDALGNMNIPLGMIFFNRFWVRTWWSRVSLGSPTFPALAFGCCSHQQ